MLCTILTHEHKVYVPIMLWCTDWSLFCSCLIFMDGVYHEEYMEKAIASSSSSSTSVPSRLFYVYQKSVLSVDDGWDIKIYTIFDLHVRCVWPRARRRACCCFVKNEIHAIFCWSSYNFTELSRYVNPFKLYCSRVPGIAFKNSIPFLEYKGLELQTLTSNEVQLQFYQVHYISSLF